MTLRRKTLIFIGIATITLLIILSALSNIIIFDNYKTFEENNTKENVERVLNALSREMQDINLNMLGYSEWDDTYQFIQTEHTGSIDQTPYIHSNYTATVYSSSKLNVLLLINLDGKIIYEKGFDLKQNKFIAVPKDLLSYIANKNSFLLQHANPKDDKIGILMLQNGPLLVVSQPILKNDGSGPSRGSLLVGRYIDQAEVASISSLTKTDISFSPFNKSIVPDSIRTESLDRVDPTDIWLNWVDQDTITGSAVLNDIYGKPALILKLAKDRYIYQQGMKSTIYLIVSLLIASVTFAIITLFFINRSILSRLTQFISNIKEISTNQDFSARVKVSGHDEIAMLEQEFNSMMNSLETSQSIIKNQMYLDPLTQLPNRILFYERLKKGLDAIKDSHKKLAILFIDLDKFKNINDRYGHDIGDDLIRVTSKRLQNCIRENDTVSRLGGDEFTILLNDISNGQDVDIVINRIFKSLSRPFHIKHCKVFVTASIGISIYPADGEDAETLVKKADTAMYRVKETGRNNYLEFTAEINEVMARRLILEEELIYALDRKEMHIKYQPRINLTSGQIVGVEALLRWTHHSLGEISPGEFIPIAESSGAIIQIGEWAIQTACMQMKHWQQKGFPPFRLAINLSSIQIEQEGIIETIQNALHVNHLEPQVLELEVTESIMMKHIDESVRKLEALKQLGIKISMDDFGTGYSSLNYLKTLPLDSVKIDKSFISNLANADSDSLITKAIIDLGHNLQLTVVAEGVETWEQLCILKEQHCDEIQGYYLSKPLHANELEQFMESFKPSIEYLDDQVVF